MSLKKSFISGVKWNSVGITSRAIFQVLQISILTRFLPKEDFGLIAMALFVIQFSNIFLDMGLTSAILHKKEISKNEFSSLFWLNILIALFLYLLLYISSPLIAKFYNEIELNKIIPILGLNIVLNSIGKQHQTLLQKNIQFKQIAFVEIISFFVGLISAVYLAINNFGVFSLIYSTLLKSLIANLIFFFLGKKENSVKLHFNLKETKPFLKIGGFAMGSTLLDFFSREADILIIGKLLGPEKLGIYSLSKQLVIKLFSTITPIILNVLSPILSSIQGDSLKLKTSYLTVIKYLAIINFPIYMIIMITSKEILWIVYGSEYVESYFILSCFAFANAVRALSTPVGSLQIATGRTDLGFKWTVIRVIVSPVTIYLGALHSVEMVAILFAGLNFILIIPMWYIQIKPTIKVLFFEYINQFYKPFIIFTLFTFLFPVFNLIHFKNIFLNFFSKALLASSIYFIVQRAIDKKHLFELISLIKSFVKKT